MSICPVCGADLNPIFRSLASKGGKAARGGRKRTRTLDQYKEMQRKSVAARKRKATAGVSSSSH